MASQYQPSYPNAPHGWSPEVAMENAKQEQLELTPDHWDELAALQEYYAKHERVNLRELSDALEEWAERNICFHSFPEAPSPKVAVWRVWICRVVQ